MRIACIHIPQYALQCATRLDPSLRGAAVAMVAGREGGTGPLHAPIVVACSRAAWALGVRLGMTAAAARNLSPALAVVPVEPQLERETTRALAEGLLELTGVVDAGGRVGAGGAHLALYAAVPARTRGSAFGEKVLLRLAELGVTGRVGIADDRFTAWVAAAYGAAGQRLGDHGAAASDEGTGANHRDVITVPRGGSAAFLAPRPLSLLAIAPEVQHMLEALGVRTLGEFAALPAPSIARPLEADYQALARGDSGTHLRPYAPEAAIREEMIIRGGSVLDADGAIGAPTALGIVARRIAFRLSGRARGAVKLELGLVGGEGTIEHTLVMPAPIASADEVARVLVPVLDNVPPAPWRLRVVVTGEAVEAAVAADAGIAAAFGAFGALGVVPNATPAIVATVASSAYASAAATVITSAALEAGIAAAAATARGDAGPSAATGGRATRTTRVTGSPSLPTAPDPLSLTLAASGALFAQLERAHRRTRRGKQRRMRPAAAVSSDLFERMTGRTW